MASTMINVTMTEEQAGAASRLLQLAVLRPQEVWKAAGIDSLAAEGLTSATEGAFDAVTSALDIGTSREQNPTEAQKE